MGKWSKEKLYIKELKKLYENIPENKQKFVQDLIIEAARLKVSLDECWEEIQAGGRFYIDEKGVEKERPCSTLFTTLDKSYRLAIKHLDSLLPTEVEKKKSFSRLDDDDE